MRFPEFAGEVELTEEEKAMFRKDTDWIEGPRIFVEFKANRDAIEYTLYYRSEKTMYRCDYESRASDFLSMVDFLGEENAHNALLFLVLKNQARLDAAWTDSRFDTLFPRPLTSTSE